MREESWPTRRGSQRRAIGSVLTTPETCELLRVWERHLNQVLEQSVQLAAASPLLSVDAPAKRRAFFWDELDKLSDLYEQVRAHLAPPLPRLSVALRARRRDLGRAF